MSPEVEPWADLEIFRVRYQVPVDAERVGSETLARAVFVGMYQISVTKCFSFVFGDLG